MKKDIDELLLKHETEKHKNYILVCSVKLFKDFQKLMLEEYKIKPKGKASEWRHVVEGNSSYREGTVKFNGFDIKVYCSPKIHYGYTISDMKALPLTFMDIFK